MKIFIFLQWIILKIILPVLVFSPLFLYIFAKPPNYDEVTFIERNNINSIKILRDEFAVPHIISENLKDIFYGLGYAQAQDRLWVMTFKKLIFSGQLSQYFGRKTLNLDKMMRNFGFYRMSKINYEKTPQEEKDHLQAFADGINDYVHKLTVLPMEFQITGVKFEDWTPEDSFLMIKLLEFSLTLKWNQQLLRHYLLNFYEREFVKEVTASGDEYHYDKTLIMSDEDLKQSNIYEHNSNEHQENQQNQENQQKQKSHKIQQNQKKQENHEKNDESTSKNEYLSAGIKNIMESLYELGKGSNSWVIHGNYTKSGKPIVANDPHLSNAMPSVWYPVYFTYGVNKEKKIFGFASSGIPFIVIGQSSRVSWGITALLGDDSDLYLEKLNEEKTHYQSDGKFYPLEIINEEIQIKGEVSEIEVIRMTKHGVIFNRAYDSLIGNLSIEQNNEHFAFSWTGYLPNNFLLKTVRLMHDAANVYEFKDAVNIFESVYLNLVFADVDGNIGYAGTGLHKIRNRNDKAFFPLNGSDSQNDWLGFVPKNESIFVINPKKGFIVTANNRISSENLKHNYAGSNRPTARSLRITNLIESFIKNNQKIGVEDIKRMQVDQIDEYARINTPNLIKIVKDNLKIITKEEDQKELKKLVSILENWDCEMSGESKQALIYNVWFSILSSKLLTKIQPALLHKRFTNNYGFEQFMLRKIQDWSKKDNLHSDFCINEENENKSKISCVYNVLISLLETKEYLEKRLGQENKNWKWKNVFEAKYPHHPFSDTPLRFLYEQNHFGSGNMNTINVLVGKTQLEGFQGIHSANLRFISSLNKQENSQFVIDTGVSGCPFSPHFTDQMKLHQKGKYLEIKQDLDEEHSFYKTELIRKK